MSETDDKRSKKTAPKWHSADWAVSVFNDSEWLTFFSSHLETVKNSMGEDCFPVLAITERQVPVGVSHDDFCPDGPFEKHKGVFYCQSRGEFLDALERVVMLLRKDVENERSER